MVPPYPPPTSRRPPRVDPPGSGAYIQYAPARFYQLIDNTRMHRNLSWTDVSDQTGININVFRRLNEGATPVLPIYLTLATWATGLELPGALYDTLSALDWLHVTRDNDPILTRGGPDDDATNLEDSDQ